MECMLKGDSLLILNFGCSKTQGCNFVGMLKYELD